MLGAIGNSFRLLSARAGAVASDVELLKRHFGSVPSEYLELVSDATEIELQHDSGQYVRIWAPTGCIEMDEGYGISQRIPGALPIGDDGGGHVIFYWNGKRGFGLYHVGYGDLDGDDAKWVTSSLRSFLRDASGVESF